jgi:branched-subunit amino acid ABC-type transport system permease component
MLGAYFGWVLVSDVGVGSFWLAIVIAPLLVGLVAAAMEVFSLRPLYGRNPLDHILLTFGIAIIIEELIVSLWGAEAKSINTPALLDGTVTFGQITYPTYRLFALLVSALIIVVIWQVLVRTNIGILMRASAHDSDMVSALGVDTSKIFIGVFVLSAVLAAFSGVLLAPQGAIAPNIGISVIIDAFAIVVIGGLGSFRGAVLASIIVGLLTSYTALFVPAFADIPIFALMIVVLMIKPNGLFGLDESVAAGGH